MSRAASKRPSVDRRAPLASEVKESRRSVPEVDQIPAGARHEMSAMAMVSNRAQLAELGKVHALLRSNRQLTIVTLVLATLKLIAIVTIAIIGALRIDGAERRIDSAERRIERLEQGVFQEVR